MSKNKSKILAIDPGTREMGIAFFDKGKLIYYGVKTIKKGKSPSETLKEGRKIILRLIKDLEPNVLVVEKAFFANNRNASLLNILVDEIKDIGRRKGLKVMSFAPSTVKKAICGNGRAAKKRWQGLLSRNTRSLKSTSLRTGPGKRNITRICLMRWRWALYQELEMNKSILS
jgi:Holliday junction resolvasome RuvABC endonuclease subunit